MTPRSRRSGALALGLLLAFIAWPSAALAPVIAMLARQLVEQAITSLIKDTLLNSLSGMGCKGIALSNALNTLDGARPGLGSLSGMSMPAMMPADMALDPEQLAMMQDAQTALANPLSPPETVATIDELAELGFLPAEQDELAGAMAEELQAVPADDRKAFIESLDGGFFPPRVSEGVKLRLGAD